MRVKLVGDLDFSDRRTDGGHRNAVLFQLCLKGGDFFVGQLNNVLAVDVARLDMRDAAHIGIAHILDDFAGGTVFDNRSGRYGNFEVFGVFAVALGGHAGLSVLCDEFTAVFEVQKRVLTLVNDKNDIAAFSAVAAVRSAVRNILFPVERHAAVSAVAGLDIDFYFIKKHFLTPLRNAMLLFFAQKLKIGC